MLADLISSELPFLRRYARGLMGMQEDGDAAVEDMIESLIFRISVAPELKFRKADLFAELDRTVRERVSALAEDSGIASILNSMTTDERRALLLTVVEGFTVADTANILGLAESDVEDILRGAETSISKAVSTSVLIIEDEPLIAHQLSMIVKEAGHSVAGIATTRTAAVNLSKSYTFGIILSDIRLADESSGLDAVNDILGLLERPVPVIFITAYPEMLLKGERGEPAYLIPKPFDPLHVRTVVDQAVMSAFLGETGQAA